MSDFFRKKNEGVTIIRERFHELRDECQWLVVGVTEEAVVDPLAKKMSEPKGIADPQKYCAKALLAIIDVLRHLNSEPMRLKGVSEPVEVLPKSLQVILDWYNDNRFDAVMAKDIIEQKRCECMCTLIVELSNHNILSSIQNSLKDAPSLANYPALQAALLELEANFPATTFPSSNNLH